LDNWKVDLTGMQLTEEKPGEYTFDEAQRIYPEQLSLVEKPEKSKSQFNRGPQEGDILQFAYNMENGELFVAPPGGSLSSGFWSDLGNPIRWMSGSYNEDLDKPIVIIKKPKDLDLNKQWEYETDIMKKLQTIPLVKK